MCKADEEPISASCPLVLERRIVCKNSKQCEALRVAYFVPWGAAYKYVVHEERHARAGVDAPAPQG